MFANILLHFGKVNYKESLQKHVRQLPMGMKFDIKRRHTWSIRTHFGRVFERTMSKNAHVRSKFPGELMTFSI